MTLREYLTNNGLKLDKKTESRIGDAIAGKCLPKPPKIPLTGEDFLVNDYPPEFLEKCSEDIIEQLAKTY